jgi:hypothetical protein
MCFGLESPFDKSFAGIHRKLDRVCAGISTTPRMLPTSMALSIDRIEILLLIAPVVAIMVRRLHLFYTVGLTLASVALAFGHAPLAFALTKNFIFKAFLRFADSGRTEKKHRSNWLLKGSAGCKRNHATKTRHRSTPHLGRGYSR